MTPHVDYDEEADCLYVCVMPGASVARSIALDDLRLVDYAADGTVIGVEFVDASAGIDLHGVPSALAIEQLLGESGLDIRAVA